MLDMEVGINQVGQVTRKFYSKPMNTPFTIPSRSAHTWQIKRSTLIQEGVRRMLNTSQNTPNSVRNSILEDWDHKMNMSGYDRTFRTSVIHAAVKIYNYKVDVSNQGGRPLYRPAGWQASERAVEKLVKKQTWYSGNGIQRNQAPLIMDPTPTGQLEKDIQSIFKDSDRISGIRVKLCQRGGMKVSSTAKSDPFASKLCSREDCNICSSEQSNGNCRKSNVGYELICDPCNENGILASYQGETSKSGYERGNQHHDGLIKKLEENPLWKHSELHHNGDNALSFSMIITGTFQKAMVRQENEAIRIRESKAKYQMNSKQEFHQPSIISMVPVSNTQQADQQGNIAPIMDSYRNHTKRPRETHRNDSPNIPPRSRVKHNNHNQHNTNQQNHHTPKQQNNTTSKPNHTPYNRHYTSPYQPKTPASFKDIPVDTINPISTTRRERNDLRNKQAISRSVMRNHPSITEQRHHEVTEYRSPSVNRKVKPHNNPQEKVSVTNACKETISATN